MPNEKPGEPIVGSVLVRAYCDYCKGAFRMTPSDYQWTKDNDKDFDCGCGSKPPAAHTGLTSRQKLGCSKTG